MRRVSVYKYERRSIAHLLAPRELHPIRSRRVYRSRRLEAHHSSRAAGPLSYWCSENASPSLSAGGISLYRQQVAAACSDRATESGARGYHSNRGPHPFHPPERLRKDRPSKNSCNIKKKSRSINSSPTHIENSEYTASR
ncbi:unnamed protein product, partial [Iphiclides podalirius]